MHGSLEEGEDVGCFDSLGQWLSGLEAAKTSCAALLRRRVACSAEGWEDGRCMVRRHSGQDFDERTEAAFVAQVNHEMLGQQQLLITHVDGPNRTYSFFRAFLCG